MGSRDMHFSPHPRGTPPRYDRRASSEELLHIMDGIPPEPAYVPWRNRQYQYGRPMRVNDPYIDLTEPLLPTRAHDYSKKIRTSHIGQNPHITKRQIHKALILAAAMPAGYALGRLVHGARPKTTPARYRVQGYSKAPARPQSYKGQTKMMPKFMKNYKNTYTGPIGQSIINNNRLRQRDLMDGFLIPRKNQSYKFNAKPLIKYGSHAAANLLSAYTGPIGQAVAGELGEEVLTDLLNFQTHYKKPFKKKKERKDPRKAFGSQQYTNFKGKYVKPARKYSRKPPKLPPRPKKYKKKKRKQY